MKNRNRIERLFESFGHSSHSMNENVKVRQRELLKQIAQKVGGWEKLYDLLYDNDRLLEEYYFMAENPVIDRKELLQVLRKKVREFSDEALLHHFLKRFEDDDIDYLIDEVTEGNDSADDKVRDVVFDMLVKRGYKEKYIPEAVRNDWDLAGDLLDDLLAYHPNVIPKEALKKDEHGRTIEEFIPELTEWNDGK